MFYHELWSLFHLCICVSTIVNLLHSAPFICSYLVTCLFRYDVLVQVTWHCVGIFLASASTILYIMILMFRKCLSHMPQYLMLNKVFRHSWNNIHLLSCQILYWPIVLQDASLR